MGPHGAPWGPMGPMGAHGAPDLGWGTTSMSLGCRQDSGSGLGWGTTSMSLGCWQDLGSGSGVGDHFHELRVLAGFEPHGAPWAPSSPVVVRRNFEKFTKNCISPFWGTKMGQKLAPWGPK